MAAYEAPDELKPFREHGVEFYGISGRSHQADCPFCGKKRAFHVDPATTKWVCSSSPSHCGRKGNLTTFLGQWHAHCLEDTTRALYQELSEARNGLPESAFSYHRVAYNPITDEWTIPSWNEQGNIQDLRRWRKGKKKKVLMGTSTCKTGLWNLQALLDPAKKGWPVDICEGEWDGMALSWLNRKIKRKAIVVAAPGARSFKDEWLHYFKGRRVCWYYHRDADGVMYGRRHSLKMAKIVADQKFIKWPDDYPDGFDVRDFITGWLGKPKMNERKIYSKLHKLRVAKHWFKDEEESEAGEGAATETRERANKNVSYQETIQVFRNNLEMSHDLEVALMVIFVVVLTAQWPDDPLWLFVVGPPGSGKTELLMSLSDCPDTFYQSNVGPKALVSGFKNPGKKIEDDPSLIPQMIGKCAIFKDWTEVLGTYAIDELYGVLTGAYDGSISRTFGSGVKRDYKGRFNILAGVTTKIHGESKATVGERFMKFQLRRMSFSKIQQFLRKVIMSSGHGEERGKVLRAAVVDLLDRDIPPPDPVKYIPRWACDRIAALATIVGILRHKVEWERDGMDRVLKYRPSEEIGSRLAKQLTKLSMGLCILMGEKRLTKPLYHIVERVAFDTGIGFNLDVVEGIMELGGASEIKDLAKHVGLPVTSLRRRLEDMEMLKIVYQKRAKKTSPGAPPVVYHVTSQLEQLWKIARPLRGHIEGAKSARDRGNGEDE